MARKNVSTAAVRTWGAANLDLIPEAGRLSIVGKNGDFKPRGRVHPEVVKAFHKANRSKVYAPVVAEEPTVTFPATGLDSIGRKVTRNVTITVAEARSLYKSSDKGRLSMALVREGYEAREAAKVADQFTVAVA